MNYIPYVNIRMGTASVNRFSHGNTLPYTQLPWAMCGFMPQTDGGAGGWFFHADARAVEGIRLTHQPSPWINDYGTFLMTPQAGTRALYENYGGAWSGYRPEETTFRPDLLSVRFLRQRCTFSLTPTERGGMFTLHYDMLKNIGLTFYPLKGENDWRYDAETGLLSGWTNGHSQDKPVDFRMYIAVQFDPADIDAEASHAFDCGSLGKGFHLMLKNADITAKLGTSYLSEAQAVYNLKEDMGGKSFADVQKAAEDRWEELLHRIEIEAADEGQMKTFYSCLYRAVLFPHKAYEHDMETGKNVHYSPFTGKKHDGVRYTDNGFWDTYRTVYPLYAMIARDEYAEILDGYVADYREGGWLPRWPSFGEVGCMPSTLIDAVIADAAVKGIGTRELWQDALNGMIHHANHNGPEARYGRNGAEDYCRLGYMPRNKVHESVNLTLDAAYGDYCIARVAEVLGYDKDFIAEYDRRSKNYANLFDRETGFMRGRDEDGNMAPDFDPLRWGGEYTEGCAWQSTFAVPHDIQGLAELYGGVDKLTAKLDELFATKPEYTVDGYGFEIHEMTELAALDFGQCAISNQPSFHFPFLFSLLGDEAKSSKWVKALTEVFHATPTGYPGDEDNGTTSAWYIFAVLGIYPVCPGMPGTAGYAKTDMLVKSAKILGKTWDHNRIEEFI
ncbi:MAG: GH92 family glycosyl hydrolase [Clostridia bacterium]|nr:GH92 family glycosyl hydrolase [Clostridia bacterium]